MSNLSKIFSLVSDVPNREKRRRRTLVPRNVGIAVGMNLDEQGARLVVGVDWSRQKPTRQDGFESSHLCWVGFSNQGIFLPPVRQLIRRSSTTQRHLNSKNRREEKRIMLRKRKPKYIKICRSKRQIEGNTDESSYFLPSELLLSAIHMTFVIKSKQAQ